MGECLLRKPSLGYLREHGPVIGRGRQEVDEFKGNLCYIVTLRSAWATNTLSQTAQPNTNSNRKKSKFLLGLGHMTDFSTGEAEKEKHKFEASLSYMASLPIRKKKTR